MDSTRNKEKHRDGGRERETIVRSEMFALSSYSITRHKHRIRRTCMEGSRVWRILHAQIITIVLVENRFAERDFPAERSTCCLACATPTASPPSTALSQTLAKQPQQYIYLIASIIPTNCTLHSPCPPTNNWIPKNHSYIPVVHTHSHSLARRLSLLPFCVKHTVNRVHANSAPLAPYICRVCSLRFGLVVCVRPQKYFSTSNQKTIRMKFNASVWVLIISIMRHKQF